jgi:5-methylcytosine-specific restriction endonuclease McrA
MEGHTLMDRALVLNAGFEPLTFVSVRRAVILLLKDKAELVESHVERSLRATRYAYPYPLVIRLFTYIKIPPRLSLPVSRRWVLRRDGYACQYCGRSDGELTMDHVLPLSRGGQTVWTNVVAACVPCNRKKANRTPEEAGMRLRSQPFKPLYVALALVGSASENEIWARYLLRE